MTLFYNILGHENAIWIKDIANFDLSQAAVLEKYFLIGGHFTAPLYKAFFNHRYGVVFLRHPVDRFISSYYYIKKYGYDENAVKLDLISYIDFCENYNGWYPFINAQTHFLTGVTDNNISSDDLLDMAKENLLKMNFVGIYEFLSDSIDLLLYDCKWPPVYEIPNDNVSDNRPKLHEFDNKLLERIGQLNKIDLELYLYGVTLFNEKKRSILRECVKKNYEM